MAITVISQPKDYAPAYNNMVFTMSSTNVGQDSFSYLVDIYINGSATKEARLRVAPIPVSNYGMVDIQRVIESYISSDVLNAGETLGSYDCDDSVVEYIIAFGEEYEVANVLTQFENLTVLSSKQAINASLDYLDSIGYDFLDYNALDSSRRFLTNAPKTQKTSLTDLGNIYALDTNDEIENLYVSVSTPGNPPGTINLITVNSTSDIKRMPSCPLSLNNVDAADIFVGSQPIIPTDATSYEIIGYDGSFGAVTETLNFNIVNPCEHELRRILFLNRLGGIDYFNFYLTSDETVEIERKNIKVEPIRLNSSGIYSESSQDRENVQSYTKTTKSLKVTSDWLTEEEDAWLLELVESPEMYLQNGSELIAIEGVKLSSYKKRKHISEKLFNREFEITFSHNNYRQRR